MLELAIIHSSSSCWSSPLHLVLKKDPGYWRPYGGYRDLNAHNLPESHALPHIHLFTVNLPGTVIFIKIYLAKHTIKFPRHPKIYQRQR